MTKRFLCQLIPFRRLLLASLLCMFLLAISSGFSLGMISPLTNAILGSERPALLDNPHSLDIIAWLNRWVLSVPPLVTLRRLAIAIILVFLLKALFAYGQSYFSVLIEQGVMRNLRNQLYRHLHSLSLSFFHRSETGTLASRITHDVSLVKGAVGDGFVSVVKESLLIVAYLALAIWASWRLSLIAMIVIPGAVCLITVLGRQLRKRSKKTQEEMAGLTSTFTETISGIRVVKAFSTEEFEIKKFFKNTWDYYKSFIRFQRIGLLGPPLTEFLGVIAASIILLYGGHQILIAKTLSPDRFLIFLAASLSMMQPVKRVGMANTYIQQGLAAGERIFRLLDTEPDVPDPVNGYRIESMEDSIAFRDVSLEYEPGVKVLKNVNLRIGAGQVVALVGPSGAGKSSLADLACRFYDPSEGTVQLDGRDIRELDLKSLRSLMGVVTQETILFNDTVSKNIAYGSEETPLDKVVRAAEAANAHSFITTLPQGYSTVIGERGVKLSGGERQRIAIARAILKDPQILIFDEATSSLDTESEILVQQAIDRLLSGRTAIVIAHRLSTVKGADRIVVVSEGEIVEDGTHGELLQRAGVYKKLYDLQFTD